LKLTHAIDWCDQTNARTNEGIDDKGYGEMLVNEAERMEIKWTKRRKVVNDHDKK